MGHKELLPEPDLEDRKKAKAAKPATEVIFIRALSLKIFPSKLTLIKKPFPLNR